VIAGGVGASANELRALGGDIESALEDVNVPSYVIDPGGVIRWANRAARELVGDVRGRQFTSVVAPEEVRRSREIFARKIAGTATVTDEEVVLLDEDGNRIAVEITSVPLRNGGHVIGVFGQVRHEVPATPAVHPRLTPRQSEILHLLSHGRSTQQIADDLHLSVLTVRNHVRGVLQALGAHSRLEAVALARYDYFVAARGSLRIDPRGSSGLPPAPGTLSGSDRRTPPL
jgi:PAS domain S-box-containing protein